MQEPIGLSLVAFTSNTALYGGDLATEMMHLQVNTRTREGKGYQSTVMDAHNMTVYQQAYFLTVVAKDAYDQQVLSNNKDFVK
jgi:hypothetical protein